MAARFFLLPEEAYTQELRLAGDELAQAETALSQRMDAAQTALAAASAENAELTAECNALQTRNAEMTDAYTALQLEYDALIGLPETILQLREEYGNQVRLLEEMVMDGRSDLRICYLTFDDGPNNLTGDMLDKLEKWNVYATFFTIGTNSATGQAENLRREMMGGHTVGNHTYSHDIFGNLYSGLEEFSTQVLLQDQKVYEATGFHTQLFRFPSGSVYCGFFDEAEAWLEENGFYWIDWNASAWDSGFHSFDVGGSAISDNVWSTTKNLDIAVVLCHDFNYSTYLGLDIMIPELQEAGFIFLPLFPQSHMLDEPLPVI